MSATDDAPAPIMPAPNTHPAPPPAIGYAPHPAALQAIPLDGGGAWRMGRLLVVAKGSPLPSRCVKCNARADGSGLKRALSWHHPAIYLSILAGLIIYVILALVLRHTATVYVGLCQNHRRRRLWLINAAWILLFGALGVWYFAIANGSGVLGLAGAVVFIAACVPAVGLRTIAPKKIDERYAWIAGVHRDYLAELPEWPWGM